MQFPFYELAVTFISASMTGSIVFGYIGIDILFFRTAMYLKMHLQYLAVQFNTIGTNKSGMTLKEMIQYHTTILDLCRDFSNAFGLIVFFMISFSTLDICFAGHMLIQVKKKCNNQTLVFNLIYLFKGIKRCKNNKRTWPFLDIFP